jgi:enediyne polyketide synthase
MLLGDPAIRDAAIHAIQACIPHGTILPVGIERVILGDAPLTGPCLVRAEEREHVGDRFVYDLVIASPDGRECERWLGLRLQRVDQAAPTMAWAEPLLAPYLERRLAELVPGASATVAVANGIGNGDANGESFDWHTRRQAGSDRAIAAAVGEPTPIHRRADGKPLAVCDQVVSVTHANDMVLSIASQGRLVACDAEPVLHHESREWSDLLGYQRSALAGLVAQKESGGDYDAAATRIWSACECLKKAGLPLDTPLVFRVAETDRWVLLGAGPAIVATWIGSVRDRAAPLAVALLVGSGDEVL